MSYRALFLTRRELFLLCAFGNGVFFLAVSHIKSHFQWFETERIPRVVAIAISILLVIHDGHWIL